MGFSILLRLFIRSNEIRNTNYASLCIHAQNSIFKDITMCQMILKEMKYNLPEFCKHSFTYQHKTTLADLSCQRQQALFCLDSQESYTGPL